MYFHWAISPIQSDEKFCKKLILRIAASAATTCPCDGVNAYALEAFLVRRGDQIVTEIGEGSPWPHIWYISLNDYEHYTARRTPRLQRSSMNATKDTRSNTHSTNLLMTCTKYLNNIYIRHMFSVRPRNRVLYRLFFIKFCSGRALSKPVVQL